VLRCANLRAMSTTPHPESERQLPGFVTLLSRFLFFTGKGGIGKTSLPTATAIRLADARQCVLLISTDAAFNLDEMLGMPLFNQPLAMPGVSGLHMPNIDPDTAAEAEAYRQRVLAQHSLLLMDATGAYHRQMVQQYEGKAESKGLHIITPLMRLQDASLTRVLIVTLPEVTPVSQAAALQDDLKRAQIEPWAWVINKSIAATGTTDPLLQARLAGEIRQTERIANGLAQRTFVLPWLPEPPVGVAALGALVKGSPAAAT
jgi:anion-transporting  ArsA/GET3 family ATPase